MVIIIALLINKFPMFHNKPNLIKVTLSCMSFPIDKINAPVRFVSQNRDAERTWCDYEQVIWNCGYKLEKIR